MACLRDQLVDALDVDPPRGVLGLVGWLRAGPVEHALRVARGREKDALRETQALLDARSSARLRRHAVPFLAQLYTLTAEIPSAEAIYDARQRGETFDPHRALKQALAALLADPDVEVRVAAAVELLQIANPGELPALRSQLAELLPLLRERRGLAPEVQHALLGLGGGPDIVARLTEIAAAAGPLPPDLEVVLNALERDPEPSAAPLLARIFPRLDAIAERRDPVREVIGGAIPAWDGVTNQVVLVFQLYVRLVPVAEVSSAVELLRVATPAMAGLLVACVQDPAERGVALSAAAALDATLPGAVRTIAVKTLGRFAQASTTPAALAAVERLQRLRTDSALTHDVESALAGVGVARS